MTKISDLTALTGAGVDTAADLIPIVDMSLAGTARNKKITVAELINAIDVPERARDALGSALVAGANVTITVNDPGDTITIDAATGGAIEVLDEGVSETALLVSLDFTGSGVVANDDGSGNVTVTIPGGISTFVLGDATDVDTTGAAVGHALMHNGTEWISAGGSSFPGSPATGERFYRTDLNIEYFYDGTRWLSTQLHFLSQSMANQTASIQPTIAHPYAGVYDIYVEKVAFTTDMVGGTGVWTAQAFALNGASATALGSSISTSGDAQDVYVARSVTVNSVVSSANDGFQINYNRTSGTLKAGASIRYRLVG